MVAVLPGTSCSPTWRSLTGHGEYGLEVNAVRAARLYAWSRVGVGVALTVAPSLAVPSLADRGSLGAIRLVGVRDLALGVHALTVPGSGWRRTMLCAAADTADVVVAAKRARLGHRRAWLAIVTAAAGAAAGAATGVALALAPPTGWP